MQPAESHTYGLMMRGSSSITALVSFFLFFCAVSLPGSPFWPFVDMAAQKRSRLARALGLAARGARVSCFDVLVWLPSAVRHMAPRGETCAIRTGIGTWLGEGRGGGECRTDRNKASMGVGGGFVKYK